MHMYMLVYTHMYNILCIYIYISTCKYTYYIHIACCIVLNRNILLEIVLIQ